MKEYIKRRKETDPSFRLKCNISSSINKMMKKQYTTKKGRRTRDLVGIEISEIKLHLESKFKEGMTWDNYGEWHIDHIKPQCLFDFTDEEQIKECWALENLQPLWAKDNIKKGSSYNGR